MVLSRAIANNIYTICGTPSLERRYPASRNGGFTAQEYSSILLNNLFYHHLLESGVDADHIIRFAFDSADDLYLIGESLIQIEKEKRGVDPEKFMAYIRSKVVGEEMYYLLLDEIQMLDCFEAVLNGYLRKDNMDVFVTGSNAKLLSKDIATEFAGRGDEIHMYPLSFAEFMNIYSGDKYMGLSE